MVNNDEVSDKTQLSPKNPIDAAETSGRRSNTDRLLGDYEVVGKSHSVGVLLATELAAAIGNRDSVTSVRGGAGGGVLLVGADPSVR